MKNNLWTTKIFDVIIPSYSKNQMYTIKDADSTNGRLMQKLDDALNK
jgi:hypothetical protein